MGILHNLPFTSKTFTQTWLAHFRPGQDSYSFPFFQGVSFIKPGRLPVYINTGATHTKGISYIINPEGEFPKNAVFLIYDVPTYLMETNLTYSSKLISLDKLPQYPGFLIDLAGFKSLEDYLQQNFSKSSRYKLKKYRKRLEQSFDIRYEMYRGGIDADTYGKLFIAFRELLEKRFDDKGITNNNLASSEWEFYKKVALPMVLEGSAGLFVVYQGGTPIAITLNYFSETVLFDAITVFDIDYEKFHLGSVSVLALIEWCLENKIEKLDFSKGYFDYKKRWGTRNYDFEYHLYYSSKSWISRLLAFLIRYYFKLKQSLREKGINDLLHRWTYRLKNTRASSERRPAYKWTEAPPAGSEESLSQIAPDDPDHRKLQPAVFDFLYLSQEHLGHTKLFKHNSIPSLFLVKGKTAEKWLEVV